MADEGAVTLDMVAIAHRLDERLGIMRHAAEYRSRTQTALEAGKISGEVATALSAQVDAFAGEICTGLHVDSQPGGMRSEMRDALARAGFLPGRRQ